MPRRGIRCTTSGSGSDTGPSKRPSGCTTTSRWCEYTGSHSPARQDPVEDLEAKADFPLDAPDDHRNVDTVWLQVIRPALLDVAEETGDRFVRCPECGVEVLDDERATAPHRPACRFE
jgi:DNA-directed RNA polymerase subunit RPC12/RpoP